MNLSDLSQSFNDAALRGHDGFAANPWIAAGCIVGVFILTLLVAGDIGRWMSERNQTFHDAHLLELVEVRVAEHIDEMHQDPETARILAWERSLGI